MDSEKVTNKNNTMGDINIIPIIIALLVVFVTLVIFFLYKSKKVGRNIILIGLSDSGKTLLFSQILHSKHVPTHTSIKENTDEYSVNNKLVQLVDIPGHERLRDKFFDKFKAGARGLVFVVDSSTLQKKVRDVAEYLYEILTDPVMQSVKPKMLILCNKQDDMEAKASGVIKIAIEKEMNTLRITKSSQLESVGVNEKKVFLGRDDKDFDFSQLTQFNIEFAESQAYSKDSSTPTDIDSFKNWIVKVA